MGRRGKSPDVLAYHLAKAVSLTEGSGSPLRVIRIESPKGKNNGDLRVVRQRHNGMVLELTVAAEDWGKEV